MSMPPSLSDQIRQLEQQLLAPEIRRSPSVLGALLADEFIEFASDGKAYTKRQVIAALQREGSYARSLANFHLVPLTEKVALATYRIDRRNLASGETAESLRSSVWAHRDGRWQLVFHQGTNVAP
jgi:hypothetical protein